jgi:hypothetical protein
VARWLLEAASIYGELGWPVFPLHSPRPGEPGACSCGSIHEHAKDAGKHPRTAHGLRDATTDLDRIRSWWTRWPEANIGLATGVAFDALDLDGAEACDALDAAAPPEATEIVGPMVRTGRGVHVYVKPTGRGNTANLVPGVDWRGRGGYVVAPPSRHGLGTIYRWTPENGPASALAEAPGWLLDLWDGRRRGDHADQSGRTEAIRRGPVGSDAATRYGREALDRELGRLACSSVGSRNNDLVASAFRLGQLAAGGHLYPRSVAEHLFTVALRIGLPETEAISTIRSGLNAGMNQPRGPRT